MHLQVTLEMVRDVAHTLLTLPPHNMATMTFDTGDCCHANVGVPPVKLVAAPPADTMQQPAVPPPALLVTCHVKAEIQVLQPKKECKLWQTGVPIDVSKLYSIPVDFNGRFVMHE